MVNCNDFKGATEQHRARQLIIPIPENITRVIYRTVPGLLYERVRSRWNSIATTLAVAIIIAMPLRRPRRGATGINRGSGNIMRIE
jgi:hypothetical protein